MPRSFHGIRLSASRTIKTVAVDFGLNDVRDRLVVGRDPNIYAGPASQSASAQAGTVKAALSSAMETAGGTSAKFSQVRRPNFLPDGR